MERSQSKIPLTTALECPWRHRHLINLNNIVHPAIFLFSLTINFIRTTLFCSMLIFRRSKPALSRNPLHRVLQSEFPHPPRRKVKVMSTEKADPNSPIPTAASRWRKETLDLLNAKYNIDSVTPFKFGELLKLPSELQKGMTRSINNAKYSHRPGSRGSSQCQ